MDNQEEKKTSLPEAGDNNNQEHKIHITARPRKLKIKGSIYHSIHRFRNLSRYQQKKQIRVGFVMLIVMLLLTIAFIWHDYNERPGILERSSLKATEAGIDTITLEWKGTRNTDSYTIYYKVKGESPLGWHKVRIENNKGSKDSVTLKNLKEGTEYGVIVRADNDERTGFSTKEKFFKTRMSQHLDDVISYRRKNWF